MSHPDPRHPAEANGAYLYELPVHDSAITGTDTGMPGTDTRQYEEWHHADPPPRGAGGWDAMQEFGPPPDWTDEGVFIAGDGDRQPEWDTGPASPPPPYGTPRHHPARRLPARRAALTALVLLCITAITFVMVSPNHTIRISPAGNPAATASQPTPGVQGGSTPSAAPEAAALTKAAAERILASYWQVNNTANESRSDTLLKTVEAGSSYRMDAGTYQMDRVTDPANRQYTAFTAENLLRLHMETACRRGGALALRPHDLDPEQCLIRLREKGETVRWQPVSPTLMSHLLAHGESRGGLGSGQRLLRYANGRPITKKRYDYLWRRLGEHLAWVDTLQVSMYWIRHTTLTWVERNFGFAVAEAYAGHEDNRRGARSMGAMATYVRAGLPEVATALAALTGEPHPLAIKDPVTGPAGEYGH